MIPGPVSKSTEENLASAATIIVKADLTRLTGSTQVDTILCPLLTGRGGAIIALVAVDGALTVSAAGNVAVSQSLAQNRLYFYMYSSVAGKWYPHGVV